MKRCNNGLILVTAVSIVVAVAATGCASKKYVSRQVDQVRQQNAQYQKETNGKLAWLNNQQKTDTAQMSNRISATDQKIAETNNRLAATDQKLAETAEAAEASRGSAARAAEEAASAGPNYQVVDNADVLFAFNKATLTPAATSALDRIIVKVNETPRAVVELAGFTDQVGSPGYNLELSRRRAWAVQRYLIEHNVPARSIHTVGFGKEQAPEGMEGAAVSRTSDRRMSGPNRTLRRVNIRVLGPSAATSPTTEDIQ
jgi:outer membrane protein OmpA-like peptidoglycan-associated protein